MTSIDSAQLHPAPPEPADPRGAPPASRAGGRASHNRAIGALGEAIAAEHLRRSGYRVVARNWRCRSGELDLVVEREGVLVAVEVKTRTGPAYGHPLEAITRRKASRLRRLLSEWARHERPRAARLRIDAIGVTLRSGAAPRIDHVEGLL